MFRLNINTEIFLEIILVLLTAQSHFQLSYVDTLIFPYVLNTIYYKLLIGSLVNHEISLNLRGTQRLIKIENIIGELRCKTVNIRAIVEPPIHLLKLISRAITDKFLQVNSARPDKRWIQSLQVIGRHEYDSGFG